MVAAWTDFKRDVVWRARITLDQCSRTFGNAPCTATGTPCYYSWPTCKGPTNYNKSSYTWIFSMNRAPLVAAAIPSIIQDGIKGEATELDPTKNLTVLGKLQLMFHDLPTLPWSCPGKSVLAQNAETAGTFWTNLLARNPNYKGRAIEVLCGLRGWPEASFKVFFKGILDSIKIDGSTVTVAARDNLARLEKNFPVKQSTTNLTTAVYNGGASLYVADASQFQDPAAIGGSALVMIGDDTLYEYVAYTGLDTVANKLTGCTPGRFGTSSISHPIDTAVKNVCVIAGSGAAATWADVPGLSADECFLKLLCDYGGLPILDTHFIDLGITLVGAIAADAATLTVSDDSELPEHGYFRIDDEVIYYASHSGAVCAGLIHGMFDSDAATHENAAPVLVSEFSYETATWLGPYTYARRWHQEKSLVDLVRELRLCTDARIWQGGDSVVHFKAAPVPLYRDLPADLDESAHLSRQVMPGRDARESDRRTRVYCAYAPYEIEPGTDASKWAGVEVFGNIAIEHSNYLGEVMPETIWAAWVRDLAAANNLVSHLLIRKQYGLPRLTIALDVKDAAEIEVGDWVKITCSAARAIDGTQRPSVTYEVLQKDKLDDITYKYVLVDMTGGVDGARYPVIAPASVTANYDDASAEDRERYGWIGDANNQVGTAKDRGYSIA